VNLEAQNVRIEFSGLLNGLYGNTDVVDVFYFHPKSPYE
jgi:hypothetical protein